MAKFSKSNSVFIGAALVAAVVLVLFFLRSGSGERSDVAQHVDTFDLEGHLARIKQWDPETGFDTEAHEAALKQVGPFHKDALIATAQAHAAVRAREKTLLQENTAGATLAAAVQQVREQLAAAKQQASATEEDAATTALPSVAAGPDVALLQTRLTAKEAGLKAFYGQDDTWQELRAAYEKANAARQRAHARLQALIRARMQVNYEIEQAKRAAADEPQEGAQP